MMVTDEVTNVSSGKSYFMPSSDNEFDDADEEDDSGPDIVPEMNSADLDKTDKEIWAWKAYYLDKQLYHNYLLKELNDGKEIRHLAPFIDSLTEIGMTKDDVTQVYGNYGKYYHWVKVTMSTLNEWAFQPAHYSDRKSSDRKRKHSSSTSTAVPTADSAATSTATSTAASLLLPLLLLLLPLPPLLPLP